MFKSEEQGRAGEWRGNIRVPPTPFRWRGRLRCPLLFVRVSPDLVLDSWRLHPRGADHSGLGAVLGDPRTSPAPIPASPPAGHPPPRRCGLRAPRLTLQLGRRLAIGLKIAAPARSLARPGKGRISPAGAEPQPERSSIPHGSSSPVPLFRYAALLPGPLRSAAMQRRGALFSVPTCGRKMAAGDLGELLVPHMPTIRVPRSGDRVYKNECAFSYDSPVRKILSVVAQPAA